MGDLSTKETETAAHNSSSQILDDDDNDDDHAMRLEQVKEVVEEKEESHLNSNNNADMMNNPAKKHASFNLQEDGQDQSNVASNKKQKQTDHSNSTESHDKEKQILDKQEKEKHKKKKKKKKSATDFYFFLDEKKKELKADQENDKNELPPDHILTDKEVNAQIIDRMMNDDCKQDWWQRTCGLFTVDHWCSNFRKHPSGWGALLMIHGIPEVTGRLRSKVESDAVYAALFLSASIPVLIETSDCIMKCEAGREEAGYVEDGLTVWCDVRKQVYFLSFSLGTAFHMLSILLAMGFTNALNEAARDADVFRMFARGQGFKVTLDCETFFRIGALCNFIGITMGIWGYVGWDALILFCVLAIFVVWEFYY